MPSEIVKSYVAGNEADACCRLGFCCCILSCMQAGDAVSELERNRVWATLRLLACSGGFVAGAFATGYFGAAAIYNLFKPEDISTEIAVGALSYVAAPFLGGSIGSNVGAAAVKGTEYIAKGLYGQCKQGVYFLFPTMTEESQSINSDVEQGRSYNGPSIQGPGW